MKYLKLFEDYIFESIKFKLSVQFETILNSINKQKKKAVEPMIVKDILTNFIANLKIINF